MTLSDLIKKYRAIAADQGTQRAARNAANEIANLFDFLQNAHEIVGTKLCEKRDHAAMGYWNFDNGVDDASQEMEIYGDAVKDLEVLDGQIY